MNLFTPDYTKAFINTNQSLCISLYQPTHRSHPDREQDVIRYKNLVKEIEHSLKMSDVADDVHSILKPFENLMHDHEFWTHNDLGLAILATPDSFKIYRLPRPVKEIAVVADSFHLKPLIRLMQTSIKYQILCLDREQIKLFEGDRDKLEEVELAKEVPNTLEKALGHELTEPHLKVASYGTGTEGPPMHHGHSDKREEIHIDEERFFRKVDEALLTYHCREAKLPLILAALPEYHHLFHRISHNPYLMTEGIKLNPASLTLESLREKAWEIIEPQYSAQLESLLNEFQLACAKSKGSDQLEEIAKAAIEGRIETLFIDADQRVPGQLNKETGKITLNGISDPEVDDLLDDLGEMALKTQSQVYVIPSDKMPTNSGIAAIYRF